MKSTLPLYLLLFFSFQLLAQTVNNNVETKLNINGVFPSLSLMGGNSGRSELGIGVLLPWADKLWIEGYVAHHSEANVGLSFLDENLTLTVHPQSVTGTYGNRFIHQKSDQAIIGPHIIDKNGNVRTFTSLIDCRLAATAAHLLRPDSLVYFLTIDGLLFEANVYTLKTNLVANLISDIYKTDNQALSKKGVFINFKSAFTGNKRLVVANSSYMEKNYTGDSNDGCLAEWDGKKWSVIDSAAYLEINGKIKMFYGYGIWAVGWDNKSVKMMYFSPQSGVWRTYRLPKGSEAWEHTWNTEWMRIREVQAKRFIMDAFGILYEMPIITYNGNMLPIKPICNHLRVIPDFVFWRGMLVLGGNQTDNNVGQPQSNLLFTNIDDLWKYGKPSGWGALWRNEKVAAKTVSDPFLMNGFDKKIIHFTHQSSSASTFTIQVDLLGNGIWVNYKQVIVPAKGYAFEIFPDGYAAHWLRVISNSEVMGCTVEINYN